MDGIEDDNLENLTRRAESFERQAQEANTWEDAEETAAGKVEPVPDIDAAGNRAESLLKIGEGIAKLLIDNRLFFAPEEIQEGRESLAPVIQKYNLAGEGTGRLPYQEEISAGLYLGGLIKRFRRALAALRASDKAKAEAENKANQQPNQQQNQATQSDGEERKHKSEEQPHALSGSLGLGQVSDPDAPVWLG